VLDTHAEAARQIDPRLDRERHTRLEALAVSGHEVWVLVSVEPDAVTGAMDEVVAVAGVADHAPRRGVDGFRCRARTRSGVSRLLRAADRVMHARRLRVRWSDVHGARDVRAVRRACPAE